MLAQNFQTAAALGISDVEFESLVKVLGMLERGELAHDCDYGDRFNMGWWHDKNCGTVGCIAGWAYEVSGEVAFQDLLHGGGVPDALDDLFVPFFVPHSMEQTNSVLRTITPAQAAIALRNYLTHGEPRWAEALASDGHSND